MALLRQAFTNAAFTRLAPSLSSAVHTSAVAHAPSASASLGHIQHVLGLSGQEVEALVKEQPDLAATKPSVLQERMQFLMAGMGLSPTRLRSLILQKPALLGDLSVRELRSMTGLSE